MELMTLEQEHAGRMTIGTPPTRRVLICPTKQPRSKKISEISELRALGEKLTQLAHQVVDLFEDEVGIFIFH